MPSHTRRGAFGTTVGVGCVLRYSLARRILLLLSVNPQYMDRFLLAGVVWRMDLSVLDAIKLGRVSMGEMSCGGTGCLSCRGKQSTSLSLLSSGRSLLLFYFQY